MTTVDQQTRRRMARTGLTAFDPDKACPGYVLYTPMASPGDVYLVDMEGNVAHQWAMPHPPGLYGYLLPIRRGWTETCSTEARSGTRPGSVSRRGSGSRAA